MKAQVKKAFVFAMALAFLSGMAYSQSKETGAIEGTITDTELTPLPGVEVTITSPQLIGGAQSKITDTSGKFRFGMLMPGTYSVSAKLEGFAPHRRDAVRLYVGQTLTVDFTLEIGTLEEEITVLAQSPLIDVKDSQVGTTELDASGLNDIVFDQEMYIYHVINLQPGTTPVYHGSSSYGGQARYGNSYMMDGVEIAMPVWGSSWGIPDAQSFEEVRVYGLGAAAEYDGFTGVQMAMITKSGGNTFDGMAQLFYMGYKWTQENFNPNEHPLWEKAQEHMFQDARFEIGGPLIQDKLWFYGSIKWLSEGFGTGAIDPTTGKQSTYHKDQPKYLAKLTFQLAPQTRLSVLREFDDWIYEYQYTSVYRPKEASNYERAHTYIHNLGLFHSFSDRTFAELKIARVADINHYGGYGGGSEEASYNTPGHYDAATGMYSQNVSWWAEFPDFRNAGVVSLSHHADEFIGGSHDFKFGTEYEHIGNKDQFGYNGGFYYVDNVEVDDGVFYNYAYSYGYDRQPSGKRYSVFVQDSWRIRNNITINPGIRFSVYRGHLKTRNTTPFKTNAFAPRIGITWDIFGDHTTAFKIHYGKYYDKFKTNQFSWAAGGMQDWVMYEVMPDGSKVELYRDELSQEISVDPNIKFPGMHQFTMGLERELAKDVAVGVTFVWKKMIDWIARVNTGATYELVKFSFKDENGNSMTGAAYDKTSPSSQDKYTVTNVYADKSDSLIVDGWRKWVGIFFEFEKRFSNNWMMNVSYSLSQQKSTFDWRSPASFGGSIDPNRQLRALWNGEPPGYLFHNFKIYGTFILPLKIQLSPFINYRSASRWQRNVRATAVGGNPTIPIEKPNNRTLDNVFDFNLRVEKYFDLQGDLRVGFLADIYNVFNVGRETGVESLITSDNFGLVDDFNMGRSFKIGFRVYF